MMRWVKRPVYALTSPALFLFALCTASDAQPFIPEPIHGVTVDDRSDIRDDAFLGKLLDSLRHLSVKPTVRIVYTPGNKNGRFPASSYSEATRKIRSVAYVFGQPVDSFYMKCFTPAEHLARFKDYVTTMGPSVDIWEVGNEINGEWLYGETRECSPKASVTSTSQADVVTKMTEAYDYLKSQGKVTALTLYYDRTFAWFNSNEMFRWTKANVPDRMKTGLDYVLVSYYELDHGGYKPDWQSMANRLQAIFPNSKLGVSEFGWSDTKASDAVIKDILNRYYAVHPNVRNWVGGGFYWEFAIDMVPYDPSSGSLWNTINTAMANQK
jgi:hypothetical protein